MNISDIHTRIVSGSLTSGYEFPRALEDSVSNVQTRAEEMMDLHGFVGVPRETFEISGRAQLVRLLENGLVPESRVLDIGCGVLRAAYWLVRFLDPDCYCGIEPAWQRVQLGERYLFSPKLLEHKRPRFDYNPVFDTSVFAVKFDYFVAASIWTHCSKRHLETTLDGFVRNTGLRGVFLASYLPAEGSEDDYMGGHSGRLKSAKAFGNECGNALARRLEIVFKSMKPEHA